ncbi:MAG: menaquinone biosynthesis protein [Thermodesulfovibrionia bacterium]|nr:menaquinone biosynthesis protein [Thermodesulfovibrionia bacterium]
MSDKTKSFLKIGKIPYANLFPVYHCLEKGNKHSIYRFVNGVPSSLNKMLRDGKLDVSPSSSIEYLRHKDKYSIIPWFSVSSEGPVGSIFLFSKLPIEALDKKTIAVSSHSETSVALLKIVLKDFLSLHCKFRKVEGGSSKKNLKSFLACLLIGDEAMKEAKMIRAQSTEHRLQKIKNLSSEFCVLGSESVTYIYDLGELWFKHTGLPFVFALWIVRKKSLSQKRELIKKLFLDLIAAKRYASKKFSLIARHAPQRKWLSAKELINYWKGISYDFTDKHIEGLRLFEKYAFKDKIKS